MPPLAPPVANPLTPTSGPRFPLCDPLRGIAALTIVGFHLAINQHHVDDTATGKLFTQLNAGIAIFFVLSGFLIYHQFLAARVAGGRVSLKGYGANRLLRIVPAYWAALLILDLAHRIHVFGPDWWRYWLFLQTTKQSTALGGLNVAWSLGAELSFYLLLPLIAVALAWTSRDSLDPAGVEATIITLVAGLAIIVAGTTGRGSLWQLTIFGTFEWFAGGMLLATVIVHRPPWALRFAERTPHPWLLALIILAVMTVVLPSWSATQSHVDLLLSHLLWGVFATLVVLPAVRGRRGVHNVLNTRVSIWLGLVSYGIYLWHDSILAAVYQRGARFPAGSLVGTVAVFGAAITLGAASYYVIERPALRLRQPTSLPGSLRR